MLNRHDIFTTAHQIAKTNKIYWPHESYRDLFAAALVEAYKQAKDAEAAVEPKRAALVEMRSHFNHQLTACTEMLQNAQARNDYLNAETHKLARQDIQRRLREIAQELEALDRRQRCILRAAA